MYSPHTYCRACGYAKPGANGIKSATTEKLVEVFDLGIQPLANDFHRPESDSAGYAPLKVIFCPRCSLAQLSVVVKPEILYRNYAYVTSPSTMMKSHFERLIHDIRDETGGNRVLEIGSNDGRLLSMMKEAGYSVTGVDPAENLAMEANSKGIETKTGFFGEELAGNLSQYDIVIARHVFCHVDNWVDFVKGLESVSHFDTLILIEAPYVGNTLKHCEFDQVYHEHLSYLNIQAISMLLENTCLRIHRVIEYPIHGGAICIMLRHKNCDIPSNPIINEHFTVQDWKKFSLKAHDQIGKLSARVENLIATGKTVAGLGASAKSTVWINACKFTRKHISFIADTTSQKQYTLSPGSDIPITDEGAILRELPDYVIMFAWNYREEILKKFTKAKSMGVRFIIPVPELEIV